MSESEYDTALNLLRTEVLPLHGGLHNSRLSKAEIEKHFSDVYSETEVNRFALHHGLKTLNAKNVPYDRAILFGLAWNPLFPEHLSEAIGQWRYVLCYLPTLPVPERILAQLVLSTDPRVLEGVAVSRYPLFPKIQEALIAIDKPYVADSLIWLARRKDLTEDSQQKLAMSDRSAVTSRLLVNPHVKDEYKTAAALNLQSQGFTLAEMSAWGPYDENDDLSPEGIDIC